MNELQRQFNQDYDAKKVIKYWNEEYGVNPDAWELANELETSEAEATKSLKRIAKEEEKRGKS